MKMKANAMPRTLVIAVSAKAESLSSATAVNRSSDALPGTATPTIRFRPIGSLTTTASDFAYEICAKISFAIVSASSESFVGSESWPQESEQRDKWSFCLTAGKIDPRIRRDDEQTSTPEPHTGFQGEGGASRHQGRDDAVRTGTAV